MAAEPGEMVAPALWDGTIRFLPEFTKDEAGYKSFGSGGFETAHNRCEDCVHYIDGGGCHLVQGQIDPEAYCSEFYADYGLFAHDHGDYVEVNFEMIGPEYGFDQDDIRDLVNEIEERAQQRLRESR